VVLRGTQEIIGSTNFHSAPDQDGVIEIGLEVESALQRQGYGKEILSAMWGWVVNEPGVTRLRYTVRLSNVASMALINSFGFHLVGNYLDESGEAAQAYEISADEYRQKFASR